MKRRLLSLSLCLCMVATMLPATVFAAEENQPAALTDEIPTQAAPTGESTLSDAQQSFVDAVTALDKNALLALAADYATDPTEGGAAETAFFTVYDKVEGTDKSADALYAALTEAEQTDETVTVSYAALLDIISSVNALLNVTVDEGKTTYTDAPATAYLVYNSSSKSFEEATCSNARMVDSSITIWDNDWYVVNNDVTFNTDITANGAVHLILADGCTLTVNGQIALNNNASLTIYGQTAGTGILTINGSGINGSSEKTGTVTINGGTVTVNNSNARGNTFACNTITINGGTVTSTVTGLYTTAVGCSTTTTTVNGGTVTVSQNNGGNCFNGAVIVNGGIVEVLQTAVAAVEKSLTINGGVWIGSYRTGYYTNNGTTWNDGQYSVNNAVVNGTVSGNAVLTEDYIIPSGTTWTIPTSTTLNIPVGTTLTIAEGATLANSGTIVNNGTLKLNSGADLNGLNLSGNGTVMIGETTLVKVDGTWYADGGNVSTTGLDLSLNTPTMATRYQAGTGTIIYTPAISGNPGTPAKLTLNNATINTSEDYVYTSPAILLPDDSISIELTGTSSLRSLGTGLRGFEGKTYTFTGVGTLNVPGISADIGSPINAILESGTVNTSYATRINTLTVHGGTFNATGSLSVVKLTQTGGIVNAIGDDVTITTQTEGNTGTFSAILKDADTNNYTAYGTVTVPENTTLTLTSGSFSKADGASVVNNGVITLKKGTTAEDIKALGLTGSGMVWVVSEVDIKDVPTDYYYFNNDGTARNSQSNRMDFNQAADQGGWEESATLADDGYEWDETTNTLTLGNLHISGSSTIEIVLPDSGDVNIVLSGNTVLNNATSPTISKADAGTITVSGSGSLNLTNSTGMGGIEAAVSDLVITGGTIQATASTRPIHAKNITISGGTVTATEDIAIPVATNDASTSILAEGALIISGGTVTAHGRCSGLGAKGSITISGGSVTAEQAYPTAQRLAAIYAKGGSITLNGMEVKSPAGASVQSYKDGNNDTMQAILNADGSVATLVTIGKKTVSSSGSSGGSATTTTTTKNEDGSTTTTVTNKTTGTVTVTTKYPDGSSLVVETKKDGTATTTDKQANGVTTVSRTNEDGKAVDITVTVPASVTDKVTVQVPTDLGKTDGTVSAEITYIDGTTETVTGSYLDGKVTLAVSGSSTIKILDDFVPLTSTLPFADVATSAYYYDAVQWAVENGVTSGITATAFAPDASCTRAQTVTFLWRAMGSPEPTATVNPFTDVTADAYYYKAVLWAAENGITAGTSDTIFAPDTTVSRAQVAAFLWRAADAPVVNYAMSFADVEQDTYYTEAVRWAVSEGITTGTGATTFFPAKDCTRAQIVTFLYRNKTM